MTTKYTVCTTKDGVSGSGLPHLFVTYEALDSFVEETGLFKIMGKECHMALLYIIQLSRCCVSLWSEEINGQ